MDAPPVIPPTDIEKDDLPPDYNRATLAAARAAINNYVQANGLTDWRCVCGARNGIGWLGGGFWLMPCARCGNTIEFSTLRKAGLRDLKTSSVIDDGDLRAKGSTRKIEL